MPLRRWILIAAVVGGVTLAGCSSNGNGSSTVTTKVRTSAKAATNSGSKSLAKETNAVLTTGSEEVQADASGTSEFSDYTYEAADYSTTAYDLQAYDYPSQYESDVQTLEGDLQHESADAAAIATDAEEGKSTESAMTQLQTDEAAAATDDGTVRHDLGIAGKAPATSTTGASSSTSTSVPSGAATSTTTAARTPEPANAESTTTDPVSPPTVLNEQGSGTTTTDQFKVPNSASGWTLKWTYDCASLGTSGNFIADVQGHGSSQTTKDRGPNELGDGGKGTEHYFDAGTFTLEIASECSWTVVASAVS
jgi:outer membrane murein-binding lipoprotein Lpp